MNAQPITNKVSLHFLQANKSNHNCGLWHKTIKYEIFYAQYIYDTMREKCRKRHLYLYILLVIKINEGEVKDIMFPFPNLFSLNTTTLSTRYLIISLYLQSMVIAWTIHLSIRQRFGIISTSVNKCLLFLDTQKLTFSPCTHCSCPFVTP